MTMLEMFVAHEIYRERIRNAERAYRFRAVGRAGSGQHMTRLRHRVGNLLIGSGTRLKGKSPGNVTYAGA